VNDPREAVASLFEFVLAGAHDAPPEAVDHLLNAASEFLAAMRVFVDAADQAVDAARSARASRAGGAVRHIPVD
jgi:hypothetical protein